ncbi:uncharacterized protein LOC113232134 [Hyposmocoma kahamanoa]|uniref:uncharacterized protein LOC113232134 n=1 Tax=Hyposmocoma kahamanoa TaxID=1477025 RepID=UPI000E6D75D0|nr:uncharacterized protein LOC113232134 [Hyposmocoma kahamanoa]
MSVVYSTVKTIFNIGFILTYIGISVYVFVYGSTSDYNNITLKQVFILSRHGVRTPLAKDLDQMTPKKWPDWNKKPGYLTEKGILLEGYMGKYFSELLNKENLLPDYCPKEEEIFIYANVKQRTIESAKAFVNKAFSGCNITIHQKDHNGIDPVFNVAIHNSSLSFQKLALEQMYEQLRPLNLNKSFEDMSHILDYKLSQLCLIDNECNLITDLNKIIDVQVGFKPNIKGPLKICNSAIDAFIMENYEGFPFNNVAWGQMTESKWQDIINLSRKYHNVIFNTTLIAKDLSLPLLNYFRNIFLNDNSTKVTLLMGHDANIYTLINSMSFKPYFLPEQYELAPVSGKIVFQKWFDEVKKKDLLKISYVYQSTKQLRSGIELSLWNPPQFVTLELHNCKIDDKGYCLWDDFVKFLHTL